MEPERLEFLIISFREHPRFFQWVYEFLIPFIRFNSAPHLMTQQVDNNQSRRRGFLVFISSTFVFFAPVYLPATMGILSFAPPGSSNTCLSYKLSPLPKYLLDKSTSNNKYVNGFCHWGKGDCALCVKCGVTGHVGNDHDVPNDLPIPMAGWEQAYLRDTVFGKNTLISSSASYSMEPSHQYNRMLNKAEIWIENSKKKKKICYLLSSKWLVIFDLPAS